MIQNLKGKNISTYGFLGYPVLQAADILIYNADSVPVGQDQLPHLELCREISRRFNYLYGDTFIEPKPILAVTPKLLGLDKRKMSKSFKNYISLSETDESIRKKINSMITDPERIRKDDPGHPEVCSVYEYHCCFLNEKSAEIEEQCRQGKIGCVACKKMLLEKLLDIIGNIREKRIKLLENRNYLLDIIETGNRKARETAAETMAKVRDNMKLSNKF
jgi:tryptophanyl-tRNA synthetase